MGLRRESRYIERVKPLFFLAAFTPLFPIAAWAQGSASPPLSPGSPAPPLSIKRWLKGTPLRALPRRGLVVVEFWATWCPSCVAAMPHTSALARANPEVTFVGVGVREAWDAKRIPAFVSAMSDKVGYRLAYSGDRDGMDATWLRPAFKDTIPQAFLVKDGVVMWIGHPELLDGPLARIKAGTFDLEGSRAGFVRGLDKARRARAAKSALKAAMGLYEGGKRAAGRRALDAAVARFPENRRDAEQARFAWLADEDPAAWSVRARELAATGTTANLTIVNRFALDRAEDPMGAKLARRAMAIALEATGWKEPNTLSFATSVYAALKDEPMELRALRALLDAWPKTGWEDAEDTRSAMRRRKAQLEAKLAAVGSH